MIRFLKGEVLYTEERAVIILTNGLGYQVYVPADILAECDEELELHIHSHIREDSFDLYGFRSRSELAFFELVLGVNGVGPKMALALLSMPISHIQNAILTGDIKTLTKTPGVGKKIAERMILELKNKVIPVEGASTTSPTPAAHIQVNEDAIAALEGLGYKRKHIELGFTKLDKELKQTEELVMWFLKNA